MPFPALLLFCRLSVWVGGDLVEAEEGRVLSRLPFAAALPTISFFTESITMRIVTSSVNAKPNNENGGAKIPRGLRGLTITSLAGSTNARSELDALQAEAASIEQWWANPRWQHTKRVYSGKKALLWSGRRDAVMLCRYC